MAPPISAPPYFKPVDICDFSVPFRQERLTSGQVCVVQNLVKSKAVVHVVKHVTEWRDSAMHPFHALCAQLLLSMRTGYEV